MPRPCRRRDLALKEGDFWHLKAVRIHQHPRILEYIGIPGIKTEHSFCWLFCWLFSFPYSLDYELLRWLKGKSVGKHRFYDASPRHYFLDVFLNPLVGWQGVVRCDKKRNQVPPQFSMQLVFNLSQTPVFFSPLRVSGQRWQFLHCKVRSSQRVLKHHGCACPLSCFWGIPMWHQELAWHISPASPPKEKCASNSGLLVRFHMCLTRCSKILPYFNIQYSPYFRCVP